MLKTPREINVYGALGCLGQPRAVKGSLGQPWRPGEALWRPQGFWNSRVPAGTSLVPAGTSLASLFFLLENYGKHEIPLKHILYGLKWKSIFFRKVQGFDVKMHQNRQKTVKTSELEDQYAVIFSLSLWSEEPREIGFFKKNVFSQKQ